MLDWIELSAGVRWQKVCVRLAYSIGWVPLGHPRLPEREDFPWTICKQTVLVSASVLQGCVGEVRERLGGA